MKEKISFDSSNFYLGTKAKFKGCKRPKRDPDYISYSRYEEISSEYWYGSDKKGSFVIRSSEHWSNSNKWSEVFTCKKIVTCYWWLITNLKNKYHHNNSSFESHCGKAYFKDFERNS